MTNKLVITLAVAGRLFGTPVVITAPFLLKMYSLWFVFFIFLVPAGPDDLYAAGKSSDANYKSLIATDEDKVVRRVRFVNNDSFSNGSLRTIIRTRTNRQVLGIPGASLWYGLYRLSGGRFGEAPSLLDRDVVARDIQRLESYYENHGYFEASIDTSIIEYEPNRVEVSFFIHEGRRSRLTQVVYDGLPEFADKHLAENFMGRSPLTQTPVNDTTYESGQDFTYEQVITERDRIVSFLRNQGYAAVQRDSIESYVRQDSLNHLDLYLMYKIYPGSLYKFGDLNISLSGPQDGDIEFETDTLKGEPFAIEPFTINLRKSPESFTHFDLLTNHVLFRPGDLYEHDLYMRTVNQYQNLGMLTVRQFGLSEGGLPDFGQEHLPVYLDMQTLPKHRFRTDVFGMQRVGFGAGAGIRYINSNLFGSAETFALGFKGSFEYIGSNRSLQGSTEFLRSLEANAEYTVPRLAFPFALLDNSPYFVNTRTRYNFSVAQVSQQYFNIDANIRFNQQFEVIHNRKSTSFLDLIELDWLDASASDEFRDRLYERFRNRDSIVNAGDSGIDSLQVNLILEDFNPQFSSIVRYTFRTSDTDLIQRNYGYYSEASIEIGGNIPYFIDRLVVTPGTLEGTIPSLSLTARDLTYSQFIKASFDFRRYNPVLGNGVFAYRAYAGFAQSYGINSQIPLNRRFFAGGSNDIRGWPPLRLGPGAVEQGEVSINGGEIKLAGFMEYRHTFLKNFLSTNWSMALFTDFGNIWYGPRSRFEEGRFKWDDFYKEVAVGSGFGLRLDWDYLILRIDAAYRVHDLQEGWFNVGDQYLHFGIGHSF
ncbi:MAG: BamA/TamA family outer membrane protein [Balneolales bacterium]